MARKKPSYCHFPIQNLKVKLPYIRIYIKIKLYSDYSTAPLAPSQWYQCVSGVLFIGEKKHYYILQFVVSDVYLWFNTTVS